MGRDRFVAIEWGDQKNQRHHEFGFCDHGYRLQTREEVEVYQDLKAHGYMVHKHGWPDFMARKDNEVRLIEVKSSTDTLKHSQRVVNTGLQQLGVPVEVIVKDNPYRRRRRGFSS